MSTNQADDENLQSNIKRWRVIVGTFGAIVVLAYLIRFLGFPGDSHDKWGQFGDYIGGLLNPVVAFAAFYWLTQSVKLQKQELADTRAALEVQAKAAKASVRLQALTAMYEVYATDENNFEQRIIALEAELRAARRAKNTKDAISIQRQIDGFRAIGNAPRVTKLPFFREIRAILDEYSEKPPAPQ